MLLLSILFACSQPSTFVTTCPYDNPIRDTGGTVLPLVPLKSDVTAYQCTDDLRDCVAAEVYIGTRGTWEAECVDDDATRPTLLVEWVVL